MNEKLADKKDEVRDDLERLQLDALFRNSKSQRRQKTQLALAAVLSCLVGMATIGFNLFERAKNPFSSLDLATYLFRAPPVEAPDFAKAKSDLLESLKQTLAESGDRYTGGTDNALLSAEVSQLASRLELIEKSISENPERALSIPLLRRDLDELTRKLEEFRVSAKLDSDRLWSQQNTILQGIGALLLAVAVAAVTILYRAVRPSEAGQ